MVCSDKIYLSAGYNRKSNRREYLAVYNDEYYLLRIGSMAVLVLIKQVLGNYRFTRSG